MYSFTSKYLYPFIYLSAHACLVFVYVLVFMTQDIVNNYPVTINKPIYHTRISK